uniref:PHD-type domain-containing protein n=1 Tax=Cucumis melo TaxID=3656 RepID=A0A9I9DB32_CUCME
MEEETGAEKLLRKGKEEDFDFDRVLDGEGTQGLRNLYVGGEENLISVSVSCDSERESLELEIKKGCEARVEEVVVDVFKGNGENAEVENRSRKRRKVDDGHIEGGSKKVVEKVKRKLMANKLRGSDRILRSSFGVKVECDSVAASEENNSNMEVQNCRSTRYGKKLMKLERRSEEQGSEQQLFSGDQKVKRKRGRPRKAEKEAEEVVVSPKIVVSPMKKLKRKRGRPPKLESEKNHQFVCELRNKKLKRKRGRPRKIDKENDNSLFGELNSELNTLNTLKPKRGRGRPPKLQKSNGALKNEHTEGIKVRLARKLSMKLRNRVRSNVPTDRFSSDKRHIRKAIHMKKTLPAGNDLSQGILEPEATPTASSKVITCGEKTREAKKVKKRKIEADECKRSIAKNLLRERITEILKTAGWTIQYRPRFNREYKDAVYVSPEGRTHWSITLAYNVLKRHYEEGDGDSTVYKTGFIFTPIPDEEIMTLTRVRRAGREKDGELKKQMRNENFKIRGIIENMKCNEKASYPRNPVSKSTKRKRKKALLHHDLHNSDHNSLEKGFPSSFRTQNRKRCALLVRNTEETADSSNDGYLLYNGKRTLLAWMIDLGILSLDEKVQYMNQRKTRVKLEGRLTRDGIHCNCCDEVITISKFEMHAGSRVGQPLENIYVHTGSSLLQCLLESWNKQNEPPCKGYNFVDVDVEDPNDDTCGICGDGGDLICCDSCPSTFHQSCLDIKNFPSGPWHCLYCSCKLCGQVTTELHPRDDHHEAAADMNNASGDDVDNPSFCGKKCQMLNYMMFQLHERLQMLLGVKQDMKEGFSWTLIRRSDVGSDFSLCSEVVQKIKCNSELAVALFVMDECFLPVIDHRSGINLIHNILYNCGGFYTAILEKDDEVICAASLRIHGHELAEMPFIGTRYMYRRQGMCRRFLSAIESALSSLNVEKLVIPAISEVRDTWTSVFGFKPLEETTKERMRKMSLLVFPGVEMLQKSLLKDHLSMECTTLGEGSISKSPELSEHQTSEVDATSPEETHSPCPCLNSCSEGNAKDGLGISGEPAVIESSVKPNDRVSNGDIDNPTKDVKANGADVADNNLGERNQKFENSLNSTCLSCKEDKEAGQHHTTSLGFTTSDPEDRKSELNGQLDGSKAINQKSSLEFPKGTASVDYQETAAEIGNHSDKLKSTQDEHVNQPETISSSKLPKTDPVHDGQAVIFDLEIANGCDATLHMDDKTSSPSEGDRVSEKNVVDEIVVMVQIENCGFYWTQNSNSH